MKSFVIAIITHHRKKMVLSLLDQLNLQTSKKLNCLVVENGSKQLNPKLTKKFNQLKLAYINIPHASIPKARNKAVNYALKNNFSWLVFIDDDCLPEKKWLTKINKLIKQKNNQKLAAIQGNSIGIPKNNLYVQLADQLHAHWLEKNSYHKQKITVLDTRNCLLNLNHLHKNRLKFDEQLIYASDLDLAQQLDNHKLDIQYQPKWVVFHQEKTSLIGFYRHRLRTSLAYRAVKKQAINQFSSLSLIDRLMIIRQLKIKLWEKIWLIIMLSVIYLHSSTILLIQNLKTFHGTVLSQPRSS